MPEKRLGLCRIAASGWEEEGKIELGARRQENAISATDEVRLVNVLQTFCNVSVYVQRSCLRSAILMESGGLSRICFVVNWRSTWDAHNKSFETRSPSTLTDRSEQGGSLPERPHFKQRPCRKSRASQPAHQTESDRRQGEERYCINTLAFIPSISLPTSLDLVA